MLSSYIIIPGGEGVFRLNLHKKLFYFILKDFHIEVKLHFIVKKSHVI